MFGRAVCWVTSWRMQIAEVGVPKPFKAALIEYTGSTHGLTSEERAHLKRWSDDDRSDYEWQIIDRAVHEHGLLLPPKTFIREILAIRRVAEAIANRSKYRDRYRTYANKMEEVAKILRKPHPAGMPPTLLKSEELARMLDDAARSYRKEVEPSRDVPGVVKITRQSGTPAVFMNKVSNYLKNITGRWLDDQTAVLTEITFKNIGDVESERVKRLRRKVKRGRPVRKRCC
jgi:hypothetical protein